MPRLVYLTGVALLLLAGAFLLTDRLVRPPGITEANVKRIRPGMTPTAVERLLGGPATAELLFPVHQPAMGRHTPLSADKYALPAGWRRWIAPEGAAVVYFNRDGKVAEADFEPRPLPDALGVGAAGRQPPVPPAA